MMKQWYRWALDGLLLLLFLLLTRIENTGGFWHEVLGLFLIFPVLLHLAVQGKKKLRGLHRNCRGLKLWYLINDWLLFAGMALLIFSGVLISRHAVPFIVALDPVLWENIHRITAFAELVLIGVHLGLHMDMVLAVGRKLLKKRAAAAVIIVCVMAASAMAVLRGNLFDRTLPVRKRAGKTTAQEEKQEVYLKDGAKPETGESLDDFLSRIRCDACPKHCGLSNPGCGRGTERLIEASNNYVDFSQNTEYQEKEVGWDFTDSLGVTAFAAAGSYGILLFLRDKAKGKGQR